MTNNTRSHFLRVKCNDCGNEQVIFGSVATKVKCLACEKIIAEPTGGKTPVKTQIISVLDKDAA
ncbi:30S ribosomal protein S27e [uncultured archaeon]|nr:30S ribosomal protein S27e [uncultured archaeon]